MATFTHFEDIESWKLARKLTNDIYKVSSQSPFARDFTLKDQIRRASLSVMSNIAEGFDRSGTGEFVQYLAIAKGSVGEVRCQLYVAFDQGYIDAERFAELTKLTSETQSLIGGLINYLRRSGYKGTKYRKPI